MPALEAASITTNFAPVQSLGSHLGSDNGNGFGQEETFQYTITDRFTPAGVDTSAQFQEMNDLQRLAAQNKAQQNRSGFTSYTVGPGETLYSVLQQAGFSAREIQDRGLVQQVARNSGLANANLLRPGQTLVLPPTNSGGAARFVLNP